MSPPGLTLAKLKLKISPDGKKLEGNGVETGWFHPDRNRWMPITFARKCPTLTKRFQTPPPVIEFEVEYDCCQLNPKNAAAGLKMKFIEIPDQVNRNSIEYIPTVSNNGWEISMSYSFRSDLDKHVEQCSFKAVISCA